MTKPRPPEELKQAQQKLSGHEIATSMLAESVEKARAELTNYKLGFATANEDRDKLHAELEKAKAENERLQRLLLEKAQVVEHLPKAIREALECGLQVENARLEWALGRYGKHDSACFNIYHESECVCGLTKALEGHPTALRELLGPVERLLLIFRKDSIRVGADLITRRIDEQLTRLRAVMGGPRAADRPSTQPGTPGSV